MRDNIVNTAPFLLGLGDNNEQSLKNAHDSYDVYVNEDFIGKKVLLTQTEDIHDVMDFLKKSGFTNISSHLDGDHFVIKANEDTKSLKETLSVHLQIR